VVTLAKYNNIYVSRASVIAEPHTDMTKRDVYVGGGAFALLFTAYNTAQNYLTSLVGEPLFENRLTFDMAISVL
jgi:hypothetical protein